MNKRAELHLINIHYVHVVILFYKFTVTYVVMSYKENKINKQTNILLSSI